MTISEIEIPSGVVCSDCNVTLGQLGYITKDKALALAEADDAFANKIIEGNNIRSGRLVPAWTNQGVTRDAEVSSKFKFVLSGFSHAGFCEHYNQVTPEEIHLEPNVEHMNGEDVNVYYVRGWQPGAEYFRTITSKKKSRLEEDALPARIYTEHPKDVHEAHASAVASETASVTHLTPQVLQARIAAAAATKRPAAPRVVHLASLAQAPGMVNTGARAAVPALGGPGSVRARPTGDGTVRHAPSAARDIALVHSTAIVPHTRRQSDFQPPLEVPSGKRVARVPIAGANADMDPGPVREPRGTTALSLLNVAAVRPVRASSGAASLARIDSSTLSLRTQPRPAPEGMSASPSLTPTRALLMQSLAASPASAKGEWGHLHKYLRPLHKYTVAMGLAGDNMSAGITHAKRI